MLKNLLNIPLQMNWFKNLFILKTIYMNQKMLHEFLRFFGCKRDHFQEIVSLREIYLL